jgi:carbon monoxide dehydrogenase subunit G
VKLAGAQKVAAPRAAVWRALMDPAVLQRILPGCEKFEAAGEHHYAAEFKAGVGSFKSTFKGEVTLFNLKPEKSYTLTSKAKGSGAFVEGTAHVELEDAGKETNVKYSAEVKVGGALAALGGRLMEAAAHKNIADTFHNLAKEFGK